MSIAERLKSSFIGQFWLKHEQKIIILIGISLIAAISFEVGYLKGQKNQKEPIVVNQAACQPCQKNANVDNSLNSASSDKNQTSAKKQKCAFVASKNSNKYHLATCQFAQKIKPENKICFSSAEEAQKRGYQGAKCCIK